MIDQNDGKQENHIIHRLLSMKLLFDNFDNKNVIIINKIHVNYNTIISTSMIRIISIRTKTSTTTTTITATINKHQQQHKQL